MHSQDIEQLSELLQMSENLCVFSGAGISCPSGIPDFRSADGIYEQKTGQNYTPEQMISHTFWRTYPQLFYSFYNSKMLYPDAKPNAAHRFFAELEQQKEVTVVTQNIDGLHTAAGSSHVCELHGSVHRNHCIGCGRFFDLTGYLEAVGEDGIPRCPACGKIIKPDVVLYQESLDEDVMRDAARSISEADTMVIVGTSLVVYPAASFIRFFRGEHLILLNKGETPYDDDVTLALHEDIVEIVNRLRELQ